MKTGFDIIPIRGRDQIAGEYQTSFDAADEKRRYEVRVELDEEGTIVRCLCERVTVYGRTPRRKDLWGEFMPSDEPMGERDWGEYCLEFWEQEIRVALGLEV